MRRTVKRHIEESKLPLGYSDLSQTDITLLTRILSHGPGSAVYLQRTYEEAVRRLVSDLPLHLQSKSPPLTGLCSLHGSLNPLPLNNLCDDFRQEIDVRIPKQWYRLRGESLLSSKHTELLTLLEDVSSLWLKPEVFARKHGRNQKTDMLFGYQSNKCSACILAHIGSNIDILTILGACFVGRMRTSMWKRSKRIFWIEEWIRECTHHDDQEAAIRKMWDLGSELRDIRKEASELNEERAYIDEYIDRAEHRTSHHTQHQCKLPKRPCEHAADDRAVTVTLANLNGFQAYTSRRGSHVDRQTLTPTFMHPRAPPTRPRANSASGPPRGVSLSYQGSDHGLNGGSSVRSNEEGIRKKPLQMPPSKPSSLASVDPYLQDTVELFKPANDRHLTSNTRYPDAPEPPRTATTPNQLQRVRCPPRKLAPVTVPKRSYGGQLIDDVPQTGVLWKLRMMKAPRLRTGKNGQVKGPFDTVSELSLVTEDGEWI